MALLLFIYEQSIFQKQPNFKDNTCNPTATAAANTTPDTTTIDDGKFHKVNAAVEVDAAGTGVSTALGGLTVAASVPANSYIEEGSNVTVTFAITANSGTATSAVNAMMDAVAGVTSGSFTTAAELVAINTSTDTTNTDTVTIGTTVTTEDIDLSYTLSA